MRLWSIHPKYIDQQGLVALWREALLAKKVLAGETEGYRHHPQLTRFRRTENPISYIDSYLSAVWKEAAARGYSFDESKIGHLPKKIQKIKVMKGQIAFEWDHLLRKTKLRSRQWYKKIKITAIEKIEIHPLFKIHDGGVEEWEKIKSFSDQ